MRALVVEDIEVNRMVMQLILEQLECVVVCAEDGREGVCAFESESFDVVFMDLQMPVCDGFEATRIIRAKERLENRPRSPIYAVSANTSEKDRTMSKEAGMDGFIAKPVTVQILREALRAVAQRCEGTE